MPIGSDVQVFISAARALLHSLDQRVLNEEEEEELRCCIEDLARIFLHRGHNTEDSGRHAA
jgi:hypothetical protein